MNGRVAGAGGGGAPANTSRNQATSQIGLPQKALGSKSGDMIPPENWHNHAVLRCNGSRHSQKDKRGDYPAITLLAVFGHAERPTSLAKEIAPAIIPSLYTAPDGRSHKAQQANGRFAAICGDIDEGNVALERLEQLVSQFFGEVASLIYSTASATPENRKWRLLIPLDKPLA